MVLTLALPVMRGFRWFRVAGFESGLKLLQFRRLGSVQGRRVHPGRGPVLGLSVSALAAGSG